MNRLPFATALISIVVAVGLWLIATWLESDSDWLKAQPETASEISDATVRPDSPVQTNAVETSCDQVEDALRQQVSASQSCSNDDDCTLFDYGYPIECLTSVAKAEITTLRLAYRNYQRSCAYRVYYDCPTGRMQRQAVCRSNRCTVELQSNEILEEQTLDYLGINPRHEE
jgi:hypothetical protein